jgi:translin
MTLETLVATCASQLDAVYQAREQAITVSRRLIRQCANTIRAAHREEYAEAEKLLTEAGEIAAELRAAVAERPYLQSAGYTQDALKEYAEASLVYAFLLGHEPPGAAALEMQAAAYLNGMAEAASELRRAILDRLRRGEVERSEELLTLMSDIQSMLMSIDYPEAVTGGLRRSTDALRAVLERTRGDVTNAIRQERLLHALATFEQRLDPPADPSADTTHG